MFKRLCKLAAGAALMGVVLGTGITGPTVTHLAGGLAGGVVAGGGSASGGLSSSIVTAAAPSTAARYTAIRPAGAAMGLGGDISR